MALSVDDPDNSTRQLTFLDLCYRGTDGQCTLDGGYLWHWLNNFTRFLDEVCYHTWCSWCSVVSTLILLTSIPASCTG